MAEDYLSAYRRLLRIRRSNGKTQGTWPQQLDLNGSNGLKPVATVEPLLAPLEPGLISEVTL
jgi:hypothetical protein